MQQALISDREGPPRSWTLYFPDDEHAAEDRRAVLLQDLLPRLAPQAAWLADRLQGGQTTGRHRLLISFEELQNTCKSAELSVALGLQPVEALACLGAAAHEVQPVCLLQRHWCLLSNPQKACKTVLNAARPVGLQVLFGPQARHYLPDGLEPLKLVVRLEGYPASLRHIRQLKSSSIGMRCTEAICKWVYIHCCYSAKCICATCNLLPYTVVSCCIANS